MVSLLSGVTTKANALEFHGINVSGIDSIAFYYLNIPLTQIYNRAPLTSGDSRQNTRVDSFRPAAVRNRPSGQRSTLSDYQRGSVEVDVTKLVMVTFHNLRIIDRQPWVARRNHQTQITEPHFDSGQPPFIMFHARIRLPRNNLVNNSSQIRFLSDVSVSLSNNFYQIFRRLEPQDFYNATISIIYNYHVYRIYVNSPVWVDNRRFDFAIPNMTTTQVRRPPSAVDPDDDDFYVGGGNTGDNTHPTDPANPYRPPSGNNLLAFLANLFGITIEELQMYLIIAGVIFVAVVVGIPLIKGAVSSK